MEWLTYLMSPGVYSFYTTPWNEQQTHGSQSWGVFSLPSAIEWSAHPMSPGVYSLYMTPWKEQQTHSVLGCILPAQRHRVVNTPNESWGVFSLYNAMEWTTDPVSPGVYCLPMALWNDKLTYWVLVCNRMTKRASESRSVEGLATVVTDG